MSLPGPPVVGSSLLANPLGGTVVPVVPGVGDRGDIIFPKTETPARRRRLSIRAEGREGDEYACDGDDGAQQHSLGFVACRHGWVRTTKPVRCLDQVRAQAQLSVWGRGCARGGDRGDRSVCRRGRCVAGRSGPRSPTPPSRSGRPAVGARRHGDAAATPVDCPATRTSTGSVGLSEAWLRPASGRGLRGRRVLPRRRRRSSGRR